MDLQVLLVQRVQLVRSLPLHLDHQRARLVLWGPPVQAVREFQECLCFLVLQENPKVLECQEVQLDLDFQLVPVVRLVQMVPWARQDPYHQEVREFQMIQQVPPVQMDQVHREDQHYQSAQMVPEVLVCLNFQFLLQVLANQTDRRDPVVLGRR